VVVGLYQPLADDGAYTTFVMQATSDHACPLQSLQKTKKRGLSPIRSSSPSRRLGLLLSTQSRARHWYCSCGGRAKPFASYPTARVARGQALRFLPNCSCGARAKPFGLHTPGARRALPSRHTEHPANSAVACGPPPMSHCGVTGGISLRAPGAWSPKACATR